eukprot:13459152-Ditylum_brightwellii.AAC.1
MERTLGRKRDKVDIWLGKRKVKNRPCQNRLRGWDAAIFFFNSNKNPYSYSTPMNSQTRLGRIIHLYSNVDGGTGPIGDSRSIVFVREPPTFESQGIFSSRNES